ncbi:MAG: gamma-glutamylcyclotransferase [Dehalococcoidia bacterium]|jgi:hypothetical protein
MRDWTGTCQRCGKEGRSYIMSMFNEDLICMDCKKKETKQPGYEEARRAEHEAVKSGNYNFKGIDFG